MSIVRTPAGTTSLGERGYTQDTPASSLNSVPPSFGSTTTVTACCGDPFTVGASNVSPAQPSGLDPNPDRRRSAGTYRFSKAITSFPEPGTIHREYRSAVIATIDTPSPAWLRRSDLASAPVNLTAPGG